MSVTIGIDTSALDPSFKSHAGRGIGRYVTELHRYLSQARYDDIRFTFFDHRNFVLPRPMERLVAALPAGRQTVRQQLVYPWQLQRGVVGACDLLHFPAHMDAPSVSNRCRVVTVLDLIPLVLESLYRAERPGWRFALARWLEARAIKSASMILAISEHTKRDCVEYLGLKSDDIVVTPLGIDPQFQSDARRLAEMSSEEKQELRGRFGIPHEAYLVMYVGGIDPRKNWRGLLHILRELRSWQVSHSERPICCVMAGRIQRDEQYPALLSAIKELELTRTVLLPGFVADEELRELYTIADLFLFPSLYEGFGLPPLEAMACGVPVVSSNTSCMPEILGGAAALVDPRDVDSFARAAISVLTNADKAYAMREAGQARARQFTWDETGRRTIAAYRELIARKNLQRAA